MVVRRIVILGLLVIGIISSLIVGCVTQENSTGKAFSEADALASVLKDNPEFPEKPGEVNTIEVRAGGPAPGVIVEAELTTKIEKSIENTYIITLTKEWKATISGVQPISYWKYKVDPRNITLIESEDNDAMISTIK